ncbi:hypothetical protein [Actomonas aquatica]|uniref:Glycosyltransferase RgtA/B/C/D-like domain-containing protein n=1 Tax=Actomonas aquatica TaxID=2866162 RepID=A0ABZ1CA35_9BACT|nr:hypothetical protein [Opitutus sp. WL0086]WRQ88510.1 hypothetical protein K1X11_003785 [Opitutus sp. WL0086]
MADRKHSKPAPRWPLWLALLCAVLAAFLAWQRGSQTDVELAPSDIRWERLNNLTWDAETATLTVTGPDPFGHLAIPAASMPLTELRINALGPYHPGGWYVYPSPAHLGAPVINQDWVVTATVEDTPVGHALVWELEDSRLARIDLPDELDVPLQVSSIQLRSPWGSLANPYVVAMICAVGLSALLLIGALLARSLEHKPVELAVMLALTAAKVWLVVGIGQTIFAGAIHDDRLFMDQARAFAAGEWLGPYHELTLAKGPAYAMLVALSALTGLPLQLNTALFHALACGLFVWALSPWLRSAGPRLLVFTILLLDPQNLSAEVVGRVLRSAVQTPLVLLTLAGFVGLLARSRVRDLTTARLVPWALLAGLSASVFWASREEAIWLAPSIALTLGAAVIGLWTAPHGSRLARLAVCLLPLLVFQGLRMTHRAWNASHYGQVVTVDVAEGSFPAAYGAMLRVDPIDPIPGVPLTLATRETIYPHSPAFAEIAPLLDGELTEKWAKPGWGRDGNHARAGLEIRGGWYQWALREAAARLGYYESATAAETYWARVATEINTAVDSGALAGGKSRHGFFPRWQEAYSDQVTPALGQALDLVVRCTDFKAVAVPSSGNPEQIEELAAFLHARPVWERSPPSTDGRIRLAIHRIYQLTGWWLTGFALLATAIVAWRARREVSARLQLAFLCACWGGALALSVVVTLVHVTSFYALIGAYLAPASALVIACWVLAPMWAFARREPSSPNSAS